MPLTGYTDENFTETGFNYWQKTLHKLIKHEQSALHQCAVDIIKKSSNDVGELLSSAHSKKKADNQKGLYTISSTIHFLVQQGLHFLGSHVGPGSGESNSNFKQLLQLCKDDVLNLDQWLCRSQNRSTSSVIQNEPLEIMASTILRKLDVILLEIW